MGGGAGQSWLSGNSLQVGFAKGIRQSCLLAFVFQHFDDGMILNHPDQGGARKSSHVSTHHFRPVDSCPERSLAGCALWKAGKAQACVHRLDYSSIRHVCERFATQGSQKRFSKSGERVDIRVRLPKTDAVDEHIEYRHAQSRYDPRFSLTSEFDLLVECIADRIHVADLIDPGAEFWQQFPYRRGAKQAAPPIRDRIFNPELKALADSVRSHTGTLENLPAHRLDPATYLVRPESDFWPTSMKLLSAAHLTEDHFAPVLSLLKEKTGAGAVALLMPDELEGVYRVSLQSGLDHLTERNLIIGFRDNFLDEDAPWQTLSYSDHLKQNFHYRKRFSSDFLADYPFAVFYHFPTLDTSCFCACFFPDEKSGSRIDHDWVLAFLNSIYPPILKFSHARLNPESASEDPTLKFMKLVKRFSHTGKDRFFVTHVTLSDTSALSEDHPFLGRFREFCTSHSLADRIVILSPFHVLLLHFSDNVDGPRYLLQNLALEWGIKAEFRTTEYPAEESNLYNLMLG